ncbi:MAG: signal peptidase I [Nitrososphaerota archaeon]|nr:signal peptidase I [Candidatus Bathyarchaeota archaeon]MDW8048157.1 signal peptidase I [Nitrososphaerota archaeon]
MEEANESALMRELKNLWGKSLFRTIIYFILIIFAVYAFQAILTYALNTPYPLQTPISGSMEPTLKVGDLLIVKGVNAEDIVAAPKPTGDIIVFKKPGSPEELVVHRAVQKYMVGGKWYFRTQGDNNPYMDPWVVSEDQIVGKVIFSIPYLGYVKIYLGTPLGMIINIILIILLLILENMTLSKRMKEESEDDNQV